MNKTDKKAAILKTVNKIISEKDTKVFISAFIGAAMGSATAIFMTRLVDTCTRKKMLGKLGIKVPSGAMFGRVKGINITPNQNKQNDHNYDNAIEKCDCPVCSEQNEDNDNADAEDAEFDLNDEFTEDGYYNDEDDE